MRIEVTKYDFSGNEDKNINFFTGISTVGTSIDLYDYLEKDGMSNINYEFEGVDSENSIYVKCSNVTLTCKSDIYNGTNLTDYFELYLQNKYIKFKANFYDEDDVLFYSGIIQTDGIEISDLRDDLLSITVLGYEKEFKEGFSNRPLLDASSLNYDLPPGTPLNITGLYFYTAERLIKYNFGNILDDTTALFLRNIFISKHPYTYANSSRFEDYGNTTIHIKTGYKCFYQDEISRFEWFDSLCLSMGWVWFFYLGKLVIQERRDNDFPIKHIDYNELIIRNGLTNRVEQFQCANVIIKSGEYFGTATDIYYNRGGADTIYSNTNDYTNITFPFYKLNFSSPNSYFTTPNSNHIYRVNASQDEWRYSYSRNRYTTAINSSVTGIEWNYDIKKTIIISPYICSKDNAGGIDTLNARTNTGAYYGNGNFYYAAAREDTGTSKILYTGHAGHSVVTYNSTTTKLQTYEFYSQSENFKANFKKFVKTNEDVILEIEVAELITNPLQRIHIDNFPYYDIDSKDFIIESLSFNYFDKTTILKIRMI